METLVNFLQVLLEILGPVLVLVISPMLGAVIYKFWGKLGLDTDKLNRDTLQTAISNAALEAVRRAGGPGKALRIDNMHVGPALTQALNGAPDAIKYFNLDHAEVERRVLAQATAIVQSTPVVDVPASTTGGSTNLHATIDKQLAKLVSK